jgi:hypothetical protein
MEIQYQFQNNFNRQQVAVTIVGQNISIPLDPNNIDYQNYLLWVEKGNTTLPALS